jgi:hypothetical protein
MNDGEEPAPAPDAAGKDENKAENSGSWLAKLMQLMTSFGSKITKFIASVADKFKDGKNREGKGSNSGEGQNPEPNNGKGVTDTQGAGGGGDLSSSKPGVKADLIAIAKNFGILDKSKGNKINIDDMKRIIAELEKKIASGKASKYAGKLELYKKVVQWMDANHITEFTMDDVDGDAFID